jgi:hypothetical protein
VNKTIAGISRNFLEVPKISRVGKFVQIYDRGTLGRKPPQNEVGADKPSPSGDKYRMILQLMKSRRAVRP